MKSVLQTDEWAAFKAKYGWYHQRPAGTLILWRPILLGRTMWYAPETDISSRQSIGALLAEVKPKAKSGRAFLFRLELNIPWTDDVVATLKSLRFRKSFESVQPEWRAVLDVRPGDQQILATMHPKGRYNIRVAQRHAVQVEQSKDIDAFYTLYQETAKRDGFSARPQAYFADFLTLVPGATLFLAKKDKADLAAAIVVFFGDRASYLYGASSSLEREAMAPYLLHWEIIRQSKRRGYPEYDLGEIPPTNQPDHPLKGLGDFKMKFGSRAIRLMGSWDYILSPVWYTVFRVGEKLRRGFRA